MTGLIYVVIIALWAAVLIPIWLRRHDQISEVRSTARFSSAMRSLGGPGQPQFAMGSPIDAPLISSRASRTSRTTAPEVRSMRATTDSRSTGLDHDYERELARQSAATRRAVVLGVLSCLLLLSLLLAVAAIVPRWLPLVAALPVVAFVIAAARTAPERAAARTRRPRAQRYEGEAEAPPPSMSAPAPAVVEDDWETWNAWDDDAWDAVPETLPTYVTAPRATSVPRGIDRSRPGEWTGEAMVETAQSMRSRARSGGLGERPIDHGADTTEIPALSDDYGRRRAVNE